MAISSTKTQRSPKSITIISRDSIRTLQTHHKGNAIADRGAITISATELLKMRDAAINTSTDEKVAVESFKTLRDQKAQESKARKQKMAAFDLNRTANKKLSELEEEVKLKNEYLLTKARGQLEEQEDDIKHLNELMLNAKCVAIRDAQLEEKTYIESRRKKEEMRLDEMMELDRQAALLALEAREIERHQVLKEGAGKIREQIFHRAEVRLLEQEKKDQETKKLLKIIQDNIAEDKADKQEKVKSQRQLMDQIMRANQDSILQKKREKELEEEADRKVLEYIVEKERKAAENDVALKEKQAERERELARLRAAHEKISDKAAQEDALRAQRAAEQYERDWRRKEKEAALKKLAQEEEVRAARAKQSRAKEHSIAVEAYQIKQEFYENLARQKDMEGKLKLEQVLRAENNKKYAQEIQKQIREKEESKVKDRQSFFMEGLKLAQGRLDDISRIDAIKNRKLEELRKTGVPEKYCNEVERQVHHKRPLFSK